MDSARKHIREVPCAVFLTAFGFYRHRQSSMASRWLFTPITDESAGCARQVQNPSNENSPFFLKGRIFLANLITNQRSMHTIHTAIMSVDCLLHLSIMSRWYYCPESQDEGLGAFLWEVSSMEGWGNVSPSCYRRGRCRSWIWPAFPLISRNQ